MAMVIALSDETTQRLESLAVQRGVTPEELVADLVVEHLPLVDKQVNANEALDNFIGSARGDGTRFEIHDARRELASRKMKDGARRL
jgi:predicted transcriptional regulator